MKKILFITLIFLNINLIYCQVLDTPTLLSPENGQYILTDYISLSWSSIENATNYEIIVTDFNQQPFDTIISESNLLLNLDRFFLDAVHHFYWKVKAFNIENESLWSELWSFVYYVPIPPPPPQPSDNFSNVFFSNSQNYLINNRPIQNGDAVYAIYQKSEGVWQAGGYSLFSDGNLELTVWGDDTRTPEKDGFSVGETITFKVWDSQLNKLWNANATYISGPSVYEINGFSFVSNLITAPDDIYIPLIIGWNIISSNVIPDEPAMESVFEGMNNIVFVKNGAGQIFFPALGLNQIGDWNIEDGYYVYTNGSSILNITGTEVNPVLQGIQLNPGWHLVSYLRNSPMNAQQALSSISSNLIIAKNNLGGIYHPGFGINTLGEMQPGQAYWLYISSPALLTYPEN